jgi:hypothetical protein
MTRLEIMENLGITEDDILNRPELVTEKLFCTAIINQGTEIASKILTNYLLLAKELEEKG